jgi:hypothetical protein
MYLSMASRAGSQNGVVFTDRVAQRSRRSFDVWAAAEGSASWHIEEARQARQWFDERFGKTNALIHHSHSGGVKPLGARTSTSGWVAVAGPKKLPRA